MIIRQKMIYREDLRANPGLIYVFGDNEQREGLGGQAGQMRGEPNARGVATLSFTRAWSDAEFERQARVIDHDLAPVVVELLAGKTVVLPFDGLGTGIARLHETSPRTFRFLLSRLDQLEDVRPSSLKLILTPSRDPVTFTRKILG